MNTPPAYLAAATVLIPVAATLMLAIGVPLRKTGKPAAAISLLAALASLLSSVLVFARQIGEHATPHEIRVPWLHVGTEVFAEIGVRVDGFSASMLLVVCFVATCVQIFSVGYMHDEPPAGFGRYFTYHSLFLASMNILVLAPNLLQLFVGWELVGVTSYLLIGYYFRTQSAARAAVKAFWVTKFADMGLLIGLLILHRYTHSFAWTALLTPRAADAVTMALFIAVIGKSAQFPLHVWLPDAMEGPTPVSALLHAATMVAAGVFLIVRAWPLFAIAHTTRMVMLYLGAFTALFAACIAVVQTDIKKVLAYSTCSQLGYMIAALGAGSLLGGFFHLTTHAFFKALLFLGAGSVIHAVHSNDVRDMGGLARKMKVTTAVFLLGALALAGVPGLSGFFSKDLVLEAVGHHGVSAPYVALMAGAFLTAFYMGRIIVLAFFGAPSKNAEHAHESGGWLVVPLLLLAIPTVAAGYFAGTFATAYRTHYHFHLGTTGGVAAGLAIAGFVSAFVLFNRKKSLGEPRGAIAQYANFVRFGAMDRIYLFGFHRLALPFARLVGWIDRYVIDGLMNLSGWLTIMLGRGLRRTQTGRAPDYVLAVVAGMAALIAWGVSQ